MTTIHSGSGEVLEVAVLSVRPGEENDFENAFRVAQALIAASLGCQGHQLRRSLKVPSQYLLLVRWRTLQDHTIGFRQSAPYLEWKRLLHHFYDPVPTVEHYVEVLP